MLLPHSTGMSSHFTGKHTGACAMWPPDRHRAESSRITVSFRFDDHRPPPGIADDSEVPESDFFAVDIGLLLYSSPNPLSIKIPGRPMAA
jgi:hypothetical protein